MQVAEQHQEPVPALFDDSRRALSFALNESVIEMPRPFMNKAMADAKAKKLSKAALKRARKAQKEARIPDDAIVLLEQENAPKSRKTTWGPRPLGGLDRPHQAGLILSLLERMDREHKTVLKGTMIRAYDPCSCRSPCCSGQRRNARWAEAVKETCLILEQIGDITRMPGKRGLSTQPAMRLAFVEQFFTKRVLTLEAAAMIGHVSTMTATRHRDWIFAYLEQTETEAWLRIDQVFDEAGITGSFD